MTTLQRFERGLNSWSGQLGRDYGPAMDPAMKNRLQAIGEIRARVARITAAGDFEADIALILSAVQKCQEQFDPMFDTTYGSGRDIHNRLIALLNASVTPEAFAAGWRNLVAG